MIPFLLIGAGLAAEPQTTNRTTLGAIAEGGPHTDDPNFELWLSEWLQADLVHTDDLEVELRVAGRGAVRANDDAPTDRMRLRQLGLHIDGGGWTIDVGRFAPRNGLYRLVDGVQALRAVGDTGLRVGAWGGTGVDPYSTLPSLRVGGGPVLDWQSTRGEAGFFSEFMTFAGQLDRASGVARVRYEVTDDLELAAHADVQATPLGLRLADSTVRARIDAADDVRLDVAYDGWSAAAYLVSEARDPALTRFAARSQALAGDTFVPQDAMDPTVYHMGSTMLRWMPRVGEEGLRARIVADGRYRYHVDPERRFARAGVDAGLIGLATGRLDVGVRQAYLVWSGTPGTETGAWVWLQLDDTGRLALDSTCDVVLKILDDQTGLAPAVYADAFVDWLPGKRWLLGAGYMFSNARDLDRWDSYHGLMLRVGWRYDSKDRE